MLVTTQAPTVRDLFRQDPPAPPATLVQERQKRDKVQLGSLLAGAAAGAAVGLFGPAAKIPGAALICLPSMLLSMKGVFKATHWLDQKTQNLPKPWPMVAMCGSISVLALGGFACMVGPMVMFDKALPLLPTGPLPALAGALIGGALGLASAYLFQNFNGGSQLEADYKAQLQDFYLRNPEGQVAGRTDIAEDREKVVVGGIRLPKKAKTQAPFPARSPRPPPRAAAGSGSSARPPLP